MEQRIAGSAMDEKGKVL